MKPTQTCFMVMYVTYVLYMHYVCKKALSISMRLCFYTWIFYELVGIPMGTNCAPLVVDFFLFCYKRDFMIVKVSKVAKIRNRYNQVPHLTQDTNGEVTNSQKTPQTRAKRSALSQQVTTKHI